MRPNALKSSRACARTTAEAFGRAVPERYDDYAWENNKVAYRLYGPALETSPEKLITPGIDVWVKCTEKLVIDEWYAAANTTTISATAWTATRWA